ncbi:MAG: peptidylprolyl isomerase [Dehalococcoidales bacterium]|nr:peptidylprolyl isomerase [Dehalococcoidales bacterium]
MILQTGVSYSATIKTNHGDIEIQLLPDDAPLAVNNFICLSRQGYYNGITFHRVVKDFMIQSGDPTGTGGGDPGYKFIDEEISREYLPGIVAMANRGPNTNGSQFFICLTDLRTRLAKSYTIFGLVTNGMDVVEEIGNVPVTANAGGEVSKPVDDVLVEEIIINED